MILRLTTRHENALSPLGERVARDGAFTGRRGLGEGVLVCYFQGSEESRSGSLDSGTPQGRPRFFASL